jgi:two-component system, chemotaxis family, protein-glutamate methylesterase/glutaminase
VPDNRCDVVVVGASAGGVEALSALARALPADFAAPVLIVLHVPPTGMSVLPDILSRAGPLPAVHAADGAELEVGHIYVAPPNCHLLLTGDRLELTRGPRENGHRPAIDTLFRSAAASYGGRVAGVVLSGTLDDGTAGLYAIKESGGATLVQDPREATYTSMPVSAIAYVDPDYVLPTAELAAVLVRLTAGANGKPTEEDPMLDPAPDPSAEQAQRGDLAPFSCPDCGGALWEANEGELATYRCRVGHGFSENSLAARHAETVEQALWTAYRALEEKAALSGRVARRLADRGRKDSAARFERQAAGSARHAAQIRVVLDGLEAPPDAEVAARAG